MTTSKLRSKQETPINEDNENYTLQDYTSYDKYPTRILRNTYTSTNHIFINGDVVEVLKDMPSDYVDLIFVDPPYNQGINYNINVNDKIKHEDYVELCNQWITECFRVLAPTGSIYIMNADKNIGDMILIANKYGKMRRLISWLASGRVPPLNYPDSMVNILYYTKNKDLKSSMTRYTFNPYGYLEYKPQPKIMKYTKYKSYRRVLSYWDDKRMTINGMPDINSERLLDTNGKSLHPCQLPLSILEKIILISSNPGDTVLEPFSGTGPCQAVSCRWGRNSIAIDLNPNYIKYSINRIIAELEPIVRT